jgi:ankyrin repeat protein
MHLLRHKPLSFIIFLVVAFVCVENFSIIPCIAINTQDFFNLCKSGSAQEIKIAIENGADIHVRDQNGVTVLMSAARYNNDPKVIHELIKSGLDVNARNNDAWTALLRAARYNNNHEILVGCKA